MLSTFWEGSRQPCFMGDGFTNLCGKKSCMSDLFFSAFLIIVTKDEKNLLLEQVMNGLTHNFLEKIFFKIFLKYIFLVRLKDLINPF